MRKSKINFPLKRWLDRADKFHDEKNYPEAIKWYQKVLDRNPENDQAVNEIFNIKQKLEIQARKLEQLQNTGNHEMTLEISKIEKEKNIWRDRGNKSFLRKNFQEAIHCYSKSLEIDPNDAKMWNNLGFAYKSQNNFSEAIRCYQQASKINPHGWIRLGDLHQTQENYSEAIRCYNKSLEIDPDGSQAWKKLGLAYKNQQNYLEAIRCFNLSLKISPNDADVLVELGNIYNYQQNYPEAIKYYTVSLEIDPNDADVWSNLAKIQFQLQNYPEALLCYKQVFEIDPKNVDARKRIVHIERIRISNQIVDTLGELQILREFEFIHGQIRFKIGFTNTANTVITDIEVNFKIPEALKWIGHEPDFQRMGNSVIIPKLNPEEKKVISLYLEPINCMEGDIRATISYSDARNQLHTTVMEGKTIQITCPIFFTPEDANSARVKSLYRSLTNKDRKVLPLPSANLPKIFTLLQAAIGCHDIKLISQEFSLEEKMGELVYYGVTKVKQNVMVIKAFLDGNQDVIELEVAGNHEDSITSLLAELQNQLRTSFQEHGLLKNQKAFMEMKTCVILRICPYCGEKIDPAEQLKYQNGEEISCVFCHKLLKTY